MSDKLSIAFDEENNIRVLDPEKFRESDHLKTLSMEFITKVISLDESMGSLTECLDDFAVRIEKEKLRALGERNKWESETENRKRKMMELNNFLNEKKAEL
jgi:intraflagellar transport protein 20